VKVKFRVSHYPQFGCGPFLSVFSGTILDVALTEAIQCRKTLADYDKFLWDKNMKSSYASATFIEMWEDFKWVSFDSCRLQDEIKEKDPAKWLIENIRRNPL